MATKKSDTPTSSAAKPRSPRKKAKTTKAASTTARKPAAPRGRKKSATVPGSAPPAARRKPTHAEIAARASEIWREKGGSALENWLQAERELTKS